MSVLLDIVRAKNQNSKLFKFLIEIFAMHSMRILVLIYLVLLSVSFQGFSQCTITPATITIDISKGGAIVSGGVSICMSAGQIHLIGSGTPNATAPWKSSNGAVANVSSLTNNAYIVGNGVGRSTITYTDNRGCSAVITFDVYPAAPSIIGSSVICQGDQTQFSLSGASVASSGSPWQSSNLLVSTVSTNGLVSAVAPGISTITYKDKNGCTSSINDTVGVSISGSLQVPVGGKTKLTGLGIAGTPTWNSSAPSIATVSNTGQVTGVAPGSSTITLISKGGCTDNVNVNVYSVPVISSFTPTRGLVGSSVIITGKGFSALAANNKVFFGGVLATISSASATSLTVKVPAGATYNHLLVEVDGFVVTSTQVFEVISSCTNPKFQSKSTFTLGNAYNPQYLTNADINNDGGLDIIVSNSGKDRISIIYGQGNGNFLPTIEEYGTGKAPASIAIGDFNGNGKLDIVTASRNSNSISVLIDSVNSPNAHFKKYVDYPVGPNTWGLAIGDFNNDAFQDIVATNPGSVNDAFIFLGDGKGTFSKGIGFSIFGSNSANSYSVVTADFNGDGNQDLATSSYNKNVVVVATGNGDGTFTVQPSFSTGTNPYAIAYGDFNKDGKYDIVTASSGPINTISVLLNTTSAVSSLSFSSPTYFNNLNNKIASIAVADFNGDGNVDFVTTDSLKNVVIFKGNGAGLFSEPLKFSTGSSRNSVFVSVGDFGNDGIPDIVSANNSEQTVSYLTGFCDTNTPCATPSINGKLNVSVNNTIKLTATGTPAATNPWTSGNVSVATVSTTGLVTGVSVGSTVITYTTSAGCSQMATFSVIQPPKITSISPVSGAIGANVTITGLGFSAISANNKVLFGGVHATVISSSTTSLTVSVPAGATYNQITVEVGGYLGTSTQFFNVTNICLNPQFSPFKTMTAGQATQYLASGDFDNNGTLDIVASNFSGNTVSVLMGLGNGNFAPKVDYPTGAGPASVAVGDFNADGHLDIAVACRNGRSISILLGDAGANNGKFKQEVSYSTAGSNTYGLAISDVNRDGYQDIIVTNSGAANDISVFIGSGDGKFLIKNDLSLNSTAQSYSLAVADFNRDSIPDLAIPDWDNSKVTIAKGIGDGKFSVVASLSLGTSNNPYSITVGDFNKDGKLDIATASSNLMTDNVAIFLNTSTGVNSFTFSNVAYRSISGSSATPSIVSADINGDGNVDLAAIDGTNSAVTVFKGNGAGLFGSALSYTIGTNTGPFSLSVGDFDKNGIADVITANNTSGNISYLEGICGVNCTLPSNPSTLNLCLNSTSTLNTTGSTPATTNTWTTGNPLIATVLGGVVTGRAVGKSVITYTTNLGCSQMITVSVISSVTPNVTITSNPNANTSIASGTNVTFTATTVNLNGGTVTYNFLKNNVSVQNGTSNTYSSSTLVNGDVVKCTISITGGTCLSTNTVTSNSFTMIVTAPLAAPMASGVTICSGKTATLTATGITGGFLTWYTASTGGTKLGSGASFVTPTLTSAATYYVQDSLNTKVSARTAVAVTVNPKPTISGVNSVCVAASTQLTGSPTANSWSSGSPLIASISPTGLVSGIQAGKSLITYTNTNGCFDTVSVIVNGKPVIANLTTSICSGSTFNATPTSNTSGVVTFTWLAPVVTGGITGGTAQSVGQTMMSQTLSNPTDFPQTATYTVTPMTGTCVGNTFTLKATVDVKPIVSDLSLSNCSGTPFSFSAINGTNGYVPVGTTYSWLAPVVTGGITGGTAQSTGQPNVSQTLTNSTTISQTANYTVTPQNGACKGNTFAALLTITPTFTPTVTLTVNPTNINSGDNVIFTATAANTNGGTPTYNFFVNNASVQTGANNTYTTSKLVNGDKVSSTINVAGGSCLTAKTAATGDFVVKVDAILNPPTTSNVTICEGESANLAANGATGGVLSWYDAEIGGNKLGTGLTFKSPVLSINTNFYVQDSLNGVLSTRTLVSVSVNPKPKLTIEGPNDVCPDSSVILNAKGADTYIWRDGSTNSSIQVAPNSSSNYFVTGKNSSTNCTDTISKVIKVFSRPSLSVFGSNKLCVNTSITLLKVTGADSNSWSGGQWYQKDLTGVHKIVGELQHNYRPTYSGEYWYQVKTSSCLINSNKETIEPSLQAKIEKIDGQLIAFPQNAAIYQWYVNVPPNDKHIVNISDGVLPAYYNGNYFVSVLDAVGCRSTSAKYTSVNQGSNFRMANLRMTDSTVVWEAPQNDQSNKAFISPNPAIEKVFVSLSETSNWDIKIMKVSGQIVHQLNFVGDGTVIPVNELPAGAYWVSAETENLHKESLLIIVK
jgi:hypothetical protein